MNEFARFFRANKSIDTGILSANFARLLSAGQLRRWMSVSAQRGFISVVLALASAACFAQPSDAAVAVPYVQHNSGCGPNYPDMSRSREESGVVVVTAFVEADGIPSMVQVARSSGFKRLDKAAKDAVSCFRFSPGAVEGVTTPMWVRVPIRFELK